MLGGARKVKTFSCPKGGFLFFGASPRLANLYLFLTSFDLLKAEGPEAPWQMPATRTLAFYLIKAFTESDKVLFLLIKETRFLFSSE